MDLRIPHDIPLFFDNRILPISEHLNLFLNHHLGLFNVRILVIAPNKIAFIQNCTLIFVGFKPPEIIEAEIIGKLFVELEQ